MTTSESPLAACPTELPQSTQFDVPPSDFNAVAWTNSVLSSSPSPSIPILLDLLQDHIRDSHVVLDTALKSALSAVPWVVRETDKVRQRANLLRAGVDGVGQRVEGVETGVTSSVTTIADADTVVRRVQRATELLSQAVDAERLLARLDALLASSAADGSDLVSAADVVSQLRTTLAPLKPIFELADRFKQLDDADRKLEALAAPQLKKALEGRNTQAAINARIVFDHAGRDNAFQTQYVALRGDQVKKLWTAAWEAKDAAVSDEEKAALSGTQGDFAGIGAEATLVAFYGSLFEMIRTEAEWLRVAFPDLREELLPSLICEAVGNLNNPLPVSNVFVPSSAPDAFAVVDAIADRLFGVALASVTAAARISRLFVPREFIETMQAKEDEKSVVLVDTIVKAMTALLSPFRAFWNSASQVTVRQARTMVTAIELPSIIVTSTPNSTKSVLSESAVGTASFSKFRPPLAEMAKDVETCTTEVLSIMDALLTKLNQKTCGAGISSMKQATTTISSVLSDRLLRALRLPSSRSSPVKDEWTQVSGALRLLIASSSLKRSWDTRKESFFAVAVGTATPVLEIASVVQDIPVKRVEHFFSQSESDHPQEAAVVWELVRDERLAAKVVAEFESLDSAHDFEDFVDAVLRVVYDTMFTGVKDRFASFSSRGLWSTDSTDGENSMLGFSSSPLGYATEVADYLMTIPQQLEPFVPDEEDAKYATPRSPYAFSTSSPASRDKSMRGGAGRSSQSATGNDAARIHREEEEEEEEMTNMSFAGMWISLLAIGTMELYVEKICTVQKMSEAGTRQLATDADYICNVIASLGVAPTPEMALVCRILECRADAVSIKEIAAEFVTAEQRKLIRRVAAVRGINVTI